MPLRLLQQTDDVRGKVVLLRTSLNVPIVNGEVRDMFRLRQALPTIRFLQNAGAIIVLLGHIGRKPNETLRPVLRALQSLIEVEWIDSLDTPDLGTYLKAQAPGTIFLLENLRQYAGETDNDAEFTAKLAALGDIYVNDAFANSHREHASMVGVPAYLPAYAGLQVATEVEALEAARTPQAPGLFILGGAKFETKLGLVEQYLKTYDHIFIGGALAHDVLLARGYSVGKSLVSDVSLANASFINSERLLLPVDVIVQTAGGEIKTVPIDSVSADDTIMDCGPATLTMLQPHIAAAKTILWNGPLGNYEAGFRSGTEGLAVLLADSQAATYVGGGDTVAAIDSVGRNKDLTFISTGGGAMLSYLEAGTLPALKPLLLS